MENDFIDDIVVKESDDDEELSRHFKPIPRSTSSANNSNTENSINPSTMGLEEDRERKKKSRNSVRKDGGSVMKKNLVKSKTRKNEMYFNAKYFFLEHLPLFGLIFAVCLVTVLLQKW